MCVKIHNVCFSVYKSEELVFKGLLKKIICVYRSVKGEITCVLVCLKGWNLCISV